MIRALKVYRRRLSIIREAIIPVRGAADPSAESKIFNSSFIADAEEMPGSSKG